MEIKKFKQGDHLLRGTLAQDVAEVHKILFESDYPCHNGCHTMSDYAAYDFCFFDGAWGLDFDNDVSLDGYDFSIKEIKEIVAARVVLFTKSDLLKYGEAVRKACAQSSSYVKPVVGLPEIPVVSVESILSVDLEKILVDTCGSQ